MTGCIDNRVPGLPIPAQTIVFGRVNDVEDWS